MNNEGTGVQLLPESEITEIRFEAGQVAGAAEQIVVKDEASMGEASDILGWIAKAKKGFEEKRKFFTAPLNDQVKAINNMFREYTEPLEKADVLLRGKVLTFRREQDRIRMIEEERIRKIQMAEQARLEKKAEKKGEAPPPPLPRPIMPEQTKTVRGDYGTVSAKKVWDFNIIDESQVPQEYKIVNEKAIRAAVQAGVRKLAGVEIFQREELSVRS